MAVITLTSATGAPGVTTTALAMAVAWPRPTVLVEADPVGGSAVLTGWMQTTHTHSRGVVDLTMAQREQRLAAVLPTVLIPITNTTVRLLQAARSHGQAISAASIWQPLLEIFRRLEHNGIDVIVDAGQLGMTGYAKALLDGADVAAIVTRSSVPAIAAARGWAKALSDDFGDRGVTHNLGVVVIDPNHPCRPKQVQDLLHQLPVIATIAYDLAAAEVYSVGARTPKRFASSSLVRDINATVSAMQARIAANRTRLDVHTGRDPVTVISRAVTT